MRLRIQPAAVAAVMVAACSPGTSRVPTLAPTPPADERTIAAFTGTVDLAAGTVTFVADPPVAGSAALATIPIVQDGVPGSGPPDTVELQTTAVRWPNADGCAPGVDSLEADVALNSFFTAVRLRNAHVELLSMTPTGREACNSSPAFDGHSDVNGGLWAYGDVEPGSVGANTVTWKLKLPSTANFTFKGRVVADAYQPASLYPFLGWYVPTCQEKGAACDSGALVDGRGYQLKGEAWPPSNTWGCYDGESGGYHTEESLDRLAVRAVDGPVIAAEKALRVEATVWVADPLVDVLDLYLNPDPADSAQYGNWTPVATLVPSGPGAQVLTAQLTLPVGGPHQAIRGVFRRGGTGTVPCSQGEFDDTDDLAFAVDNSQVFETIPPTVNLSPPSWPITGTATVWIDGADNSGVVTGQLQVDGTPVGSSISLPGQAEFDSTAFGNGWHVLTAVARDPSGNEATSDPLQVWFDNGPAGDRTPPTVYLGGPWGPTGGTVPVGLDASDDYYPVTGQVYLDGVPLGPEATLPLEVQLDTTTLEEGSSHTLTAVAWDQAGNQATGGPLEFLVDNTPPTVVITSPADGTEVGNSFVVTATVDDPAITWVAFYVDGSWVASDFAPPFAATLSALSLASGSHTLFAATTDAAGNEGVSAAVTFLVPADTTAPSVSMTSGWCYLPGCAVDGSGAKPSTSYPVNIQGSDNRAIARYELWVDGAFYSGVDTAYTVTSLSWLPPATEGSHTLQVRARDVSGNVSVTPIATVTVDGTRPAAYFVAPAPGDFVTGDVSASVVATDNTAVAYVAFFAAEEISGTDRTAPYEWVWDSRSCRDGINCGIWGVVIDVAGNSAFVDTVILNVANDETAKFDAGIGGWGCRGPLALCGSADIFDGRADYHFETQPSTLQGSCPDGAVTANPSNPDPYVKTVRVETIGGEPFAAGSLVRATVTAWAYASSGDAIDLYYTADATAPSWTRVGTLSPAPSTYFDTFTFDWSLSSTNPDGTHAIRAVARRGGSAVPCSTGDHDDHDDLAFEVGDRGRPIVQITSPTAGASVSGLLPLAADVTSSVGAQRVEFYVDGVLAGTDTAAPYAAQFDLRTIRNGAARVDAIAYDNAGLMGADSVYVTVDDPLTELLLNPDFEGGHTGWTEQPAGGVIDAGATYPARRGAWKAVLGGTGTAGTSSLCQTFAIPAQARRVELYTYVRSVSSETPGTSQDAMYMRLRRDGSVQVGPVVQWGATAQDMYSVYHGYGQLLTAYAGQTLQLCFEAIEDAGDPTAFLIDDLTVSWK